MRLFIFFFLFSVLATAKPVPDFYGFRPGKDVKPSINRIDERLFHQLIRDVEWIYRPYFTASNIEFKLEKHWRSGAFAASAGKTRKVWNVVIHGGIARRFGMTPDAFSIVVCHEFGHLIGGAPAFKGKKFWETTSIEGQSDYYATLRCTRLLWQYDDNVAIVRAMIQNGQLARIPYVACRQVYREPKNQALCMRAAMASYVATTAYARHNNQPLPKFVTPDFSRVRHTNFFHPTSQCRLDTYLQGALCKVGKYVPLNYKNPHQGACSRVYGQKVGVRPLCWYSPQDLPPWIVPSKTTIPGFND